MEILKGKNIITALMFTMCQNALIREEQEKYDGIYAICTDLLDDVGEGR